MGYKQVGADKVWVPSPKQEEFLKIPDSVPEALFGGAAGGGKTELALLLPVLREWHKHPSFKAIAFRRTYPQIEESLQPKSMEYFPALGARYNETKHIWRFPSGASFKLSHAEKIDDIRQHDSSEYQYIAFDEATHFDPYQYLYMLSRNRTTNKELPAITRSFTNPGGIGHTFFRDRFVKPWPTGGSIIKDTKGNTRIYIHATVRDNPYIVDRDEYIRKLECLPEADRKAKLDGDWFSFEGQVFSEWRERHYEGEPANAVHICEPFDIPSYWPIVLSIDWGYTAMICAHWCAISPDGRVFFFHEYTDKKTSIKTWGANIARISAGMNIVAAVMDPSGWKEEGHEKTIAHQAIEAIGRNLEKADNARVAGKMNFHDFLRWQVRPAKYIPKNGFEIEQYHRIYRMYGPVKANEYKLMFDPEPPESNIPRLQIMRGRCPELVKVIPLCIYDEKRKEDVQPFDGDDPYDCARYNLMAVDRYIQQCTEEFARVQRVGELLAMRDREVSSGQDQTAHYRRMEHYERTVKHSGVKPVSRYSPRFGGITRH